MSVWVDGNWVKFANLGDLHRYSRKEGFLTSCVWKKNKNPCYQQHGLTKRTFSIPQEVYSVADMV